ncbi:hypothetical protein AcV5_007926 [Taiwanofungus camphoratus]|nr:hypothetical protein AcV7_006072 [Antrodia cinnamomea]KAI0927373.1 hypothetical protein AcV5_007926 [Antrodia cinnamomea]
MDTCPPEIHSRIFSFACNDDGATGRSLALVSRYVHEVSAPFQWQSLAIAGTQQAKAFVTRLRDNNKKNRPVYHLFLCTRQLSEATDSWKSAHREDWRTFQKIILTYAAHTLETLTFIAFDPYFTSAACTADLMGIGFPRLEELTIRAPCTPSQLACAVGLYNTRNDDMVNTDAVQLTQPVGSDSRRDVTHRAVVRTVDSASCTRPALRRFHLACAYHGFAYGTKATHDFIQCVSPDLTHLRISMLDMWGSKKVARIVHAECAERGIVSPVLELDPVPGLPGNVSLPSTARDVTWDRILPDNMEAFVIQPPPAAVTNFYCSCCMDMRGDLDIMRVFEAVARDADQRFQYLPCRKKDGYGYADARADWLERLEGAGGCWMEKTDADEDTQDDEWSAAGKNVPTTKNRKKRVLRPRKILRKLARKFRTWHF